MVNLLGLVVQKFKVSLRFDVGYIVYQKIIHCRLLNYKALHGLRNYLW